MAGLTVSEKTHWKERIEKRIDATIESVVAKTDPTYLQRVAEEAQARALVSLGISELQKKLEQLKVQATELESAKRRCMAEQRSIINGTKLSDELEHISEYGYSHVVNTAVTARAKTMEDEIMTESDLGKQVLNLRKEKDNLLDTVWLATSSAQIKQLWEEVNTLLKIEPTSLEGKALKITPPMDA